MTEDVRKYLNPDVVARLSNLEIVARLVVEGFITGLHKSPYHGFSVEFAEHRQYMPGDEIKHIDWKIYGKTDRYYIKQFEEETNLKATIVLDSSGSMGYSSGNRITKLKYGAFLSAALAYLMLNQRDAVGLTIYDETIRTYLPPRSTHSYLQEILKELSSLTIGKKTSTAPVLHEVADRIKRRGLVIVISDLFDEPAKVMAALKHFRHSKNELLVLHVLDPIERSFDFENAAVFQDVETHERISTHPWHIRYAYREAMTEFINTYRKKCHEYGIDYVLLDTETPFDTALTEYLGKRRHLY